MSKHILDAVILETANRLKEYGMVDIDEVARAVGRNCGLLRQQQVGKPAEPPPWLVTQVERILDKEW